MCYENRTTPKATDIGAPPPREHPLITTITPNHHRTLQGSSALPCFVGFIMGGEHAFFGGEDRTQGLRSHVKRRSLGLPRSWDDTAADKLTS
jgi:hypothetical protein